MGSIGKLAERYGFRVLEDAAHALGYKVVGVRIAAIAFGSGSLAEADVASMLGTVERSHIFTLLDALIADDGAETLAACATMDEQGVAFAEALEELPGVGHKTASVVMVPAKTAPATSCVPSSAACAGDLPWFKCLIMFSTTTMASWYLT